jgi:hypothetical protein
MSIALTVSEIFTNLLAEDTWGKLSSFKTSGSIWKLQIFFLVKKTHIYHPAKILNQLFAVFRNYGALKWW